MSNYKNKSAGITLIALVVTIVVLLILAAISIGMLFGDNGIINKSKESKILTAIAEKKEEVQLALLEELSNNLGDKSKVSVSNVVTSIQKNYDSNAEKNAITGESTNNNDRFPGTIIYEPKASGISDTIIVTVDENLGVSIETESQEADEFSSAIKVEPAGSEYVSVNGLYYNSPDLSKFNPESTFYVTYDSTGNTETIGDRIDSISPNGNTVGSGTNNVWYDYGNKIWANVVTVTGNDVTYWTWIPRYKYTESSNTITDIKFVDNNNTCYRDVNNVKTAVDVSSMTLPDSFTFGETGLSGYWLSKYEVQSQTNSELINVTKNGTTRTVTTTAPSGTYTIYVEGVKKATGVTLPHSITGLKKNKNYDICVVSETRSQMIGRTTSSTKNIDVDISGFVPENTYYVEYDATGNTETITGRIDKVSEPENWYDYSARRWANIVTVQGNDVTYWTYIPKYEYIETNLGIQNIRFIQVTQTQADQYHVIPESFKFGDNNLKGYWLSKYEVQESTESEIERLIYNENGENVSVTTSNPSGTYTIFLNGEKKETGVSLTTPHVVNVGSGEYDIMVVSETTNRAIGKTKGKVLNIQVDLTGFNKDCTYYVLYDQNGSEIETNIKVNYDSNGTPTNVPDKSQGIWYDYSRKIWANIVTKNGGEIAYWTYIPRYQYIEANSKTKSIYFIPPTQTTADSGWTIPETFIFGNTQLKGYWLSKYEVQ